jgi:hypothetical protein
MTAGVPVGTRVGTGMGLAVGVGVGSGVGAKGVTGSEARDTFDVPTAFVAVTTNV